MKFLSWFRGSSSEELTEPKKFQPVPKWTHGGFAGKDIFCPTCAEKTHVAHFGWSALKCSNCKQMVEKYQWLMPVKRRLNND